MTESPILHVAPQGNGRTRPPESPGKPAEGQAEGGAGTDFETAFTESATGAETEPRAAKETGDADAPASAEIRVAAADVPLDSAPHNAPRAGDAIVSGAPGEPADTPVPVPDGLIVPAAAAEADPKAAASPAAVASTDHRLAEPNARPAAGPTRPDATPPGPEASAALLRADSPRQARVAPDGTGTSATAGTTDLRGGTDVRLNGPAAVSPTAPPPAAVAAQGGVQGAASVRSGKEITSVDAPRDGLPGLVGSAETRDANPSRGLAVAADPFRTDTARATVGQIAEVLRNTREGTIEISLQPEELGRVRLSLHGAEGAMTLQIHSERPETAELIRRHVALLQEEIRSLGYESVSIDLANDEHDRRESAHTPTARGAAFDDFTPGDTVSGHGTAAAAAPVAVALGGLDLRL